VPLPAGTWKANANGTEADLSIETPNQQGIFVGRFLGTDIRGFWDEFSQTISFALTVSFENGVPVTATFNGHLFRTPPNPEPGRDVIATLAGSLQMTSASLAFPFVATPSSKRNAFGWLAQITEIQ
jgi:hypothetical protein